MTWIEEKTEENYQNDSETEEKDTVLQQKKHRKRNRSGSISISTTISMPLWEACCKRDIKWSEALRIGASELLSKRGDENYLNRLQLEKKIEKLSAMLSEISAKAHELEDENKIIKNRGVI